MSLDAKRAETIFAVEALPGQFDQRADSAAACIQLMTRGARPVVRTADIYRLSGNLSAEDVERVKRYLINPVETREASRDVPETLQAEIRPPTSLTAARIPVVTFPETIPSTRMLSSVPLFFETKAAVLSPSEVMVQ